MLSKKKTLFFWIIFIIFVLIVIYLLYTLNSKSSTNILTNKLNKMNDYLIEKYTNNIEHFSNLIDNGEFKNGQNIKNNINQNGFNKIIVMSNPSKSSYVLQQKNTGNLTYYEIMIPGEINSKYYLTFWVSVQPNIDNIDFTKLVFVRIPINDSNNANNTSITPQLEIKITNKSVIEGNTWYQMQATFYTTNEIINNIFIYLNYNKNLQGDNIYFTKLSLYRLLPNAENFIYNESLNLYLNGYNDNNIGNNYIWKDISGNGNDFYFAENPIYNEQIQAYDINNNLINGPSCSKLFHSTSNSFTFIIIFNNNTFTHTEVEEEENNMTNICEIYGNNNISISININTVNNYLVCILPNKKIISNTPLIYINKTFLVVTYDNGNLGIYQDNISVLSTHTDNLYFNNNNICINKHKLWNANIYAVLNYTRIVPQDELINIRNYFMNNMNKDPKNINNVNNIIFDDNINNKFEFITIQAYNENSQNQELIMSDNEITEPNNNNKNNNKDDQCKIDCKKLCNKFIDLDNPQFNLENYNICRKNCKYVLPSCQKYCLDKKNLYEDICVTDDKVNTKCPVSYKKDNNYYVYINPESEYAKKYSFYGVRNFGSNKEQAKKKYEINFPDCNLPDIFKEGNGTVNLENCPYNIYENNPCTSSACIGVNWNINNYKELNLNNNCKKAVSHYCQVNKGIDEKCDCWLPENENNKECIEFRKYFENPKDYCKISQYNIEEHPDFNKYIRKDNIPCYGCVLDMPVGKPKQ
jgi:hypothetical protein